ncbi:FtsX-like permease family protein [Brevibacillus massiliensis]|uniref:FtsX-like permease family protein n=1 Tax=Brevibacillus massiliensis TaxID=1118054 RepID=UPI000308FA76|nr:ABC transporter permease [Brevibacillus massiliensis]
MTFSQFALRNVTRNKRTYAAFFFSSAFSVMVFFIFAMFVFHPGLQREEIGATTAQVMGVSEYIIYLFSIFFVFYSMSAFLQSRKKEFGILMMHGMSSAQLKRLIFLENMIIGLTAIAVGIGVGLIFSKLFLLAAAYVLKTEALPFYLSWTAVLITSISFTVLFLFISVFTAAFVRGSKLVELLKGRSKPKSEPKASVPLSLLAAVLILAGYVISFSVQQVQVVVAMLPVIVIVIIGTYFMFTQLNVFVIRMLKRNRLFYWHKTNLLSLSDLAYRMKDNARMFFLVSIVSTVAFCAIGSLAGFKNMIIEVQTAANPFAISYFSEAGNPQEEKHVSLIEKGLAEHHIPYKEVQAVLNHQTNAKTDRDVVLLRLSDYNRLAQALGYPTAEVKGSEALLLPTGQELGGAAGPQTANETIKLKESGLSVQTTGAVEKTVIKSFGPWAIGLVVSDQFYSEASASGTNETFFGFQVDNLADTAGVGMTLEEAIGYGDAYSFFALASVLLLVNQTFGAVLFVGLFVGVIFFVAAGSFLYFRLYTDLEHDKRQYRALVKIGLTERELGKVITTQLLLLFFVPTIVAVIHSSVAFVALHNLLQYTVFTSSAIVLGSFFLVQIVYFLFVRSMYLRQIKEAVY